LVDQIKHKYTKNNNDAQNDFPETNDWKKRLEDIKRRAMLSDTKNSSLTLKEGNASSKKAA